MAWTDDSRSLSLLDRPQVWEKKGDLRNNFEPLFSFLILTLPPVLIRLQKTHQPAMLSFTRALKAKAPLARQATSALAMPSRLHNARLYSSHKEINFGIEGRAKLLKGVEVLAKAVAVTLGPKGRHVLIAQPYGTPKITKVRSMPLLAV